MNNSYNDITSKVTKEVSNALLKELKEGNCFRAESLSRTIKILVEQGVWNKNIGV